jgi:hypothetical protein
MLQQIIALLAIAFFLGRLFWQKKKNNIAAGEFFFWLVFWLVAMLAILFIKKIDCLVAGLGFSSSGIAVLFYFGVIVLFYLHLRLSFRLEKMDRQITKIVRKIALDKENKN